MLKPLLVISLLVNALMSLLVAVALFFGTREVVLLVLLAEVLVLGCTGGVFATCQWEMVAKGLSGSRRGQALALAFGVGPFFAVLASLGANVLLAGKLPGLDETFETLPFPWNFALIFVASAPVLALGALLSSRFIVPLPAHEPPRPSFREEVIGGLVQFFGNRLILVATIAYILVYSGFQVLQNVSLYTQQAIGEPPDQYAGVQLALRFGFKIVAGFFLGWLLIQTNPKTLLIVTASLTLLGLTWALGVIGHAFLISFGILGAGELFGVYYPNYIERCSPRSHIRRNMAMTSLVTMPVGFAPVFYGAISDSLGEYDKAFGYHMSFLAAIVILIATIVLVWLCLPAQPPRQNGDREVSDA